METAGLCLEETGDDVQPEPGPREVIAAAVLQ